MEIEMAGDVKLVVSVEILFGGEASQTLYGTGPVTAPSRGARVKAL